MTVLLVAAGGAVGSVLRWWLDRLVGRSVGSRFPAGIWTVNVLGSFLLGVLTGAIWLGAPPESLRLFLGVGLCGSLTTFSTFSYDTIRLFVERARMLAALNVVGTVLAGCTAGAAGVLLSAAFH
ncbi:camphor resistance protein CrcB [Tamaricihabitans halophyticus]|uniref:Fluoride-specific ion channel FluC n=1 Tax=Tamaricihabitans halophyticus TaxID=1262583 RepID=A0A4R2R6N7_9PSEU|nr:fluoride efflux transporter CrcB [Tamaricihabitans halophyticus]TCP55291.1 camphor resistance protein CrcB [Tamaricihabitans halophyticus]